MSNAIGDVNGIRSMYFASGNSSADATVSFDAKDHTLPVTGSVNDGDGTAYEIEGGVLVEVNKTAMQESASDGSRNRSLSKAS